MVSVRVAKSYVADGSMYNRKDPLDEAVINNRRNWLGKQSIAIEDTTRLYITYDEGNSYVKYRVLDEANKSEGMLDGTGEHADALVTTTPGHVLFLPVADCIATTLFDEEHSVLMLSHLGRQSLEQNGGVESVRFLTEHYGTKPENLKIWLSASVSKELYPIFKLNNQGMKETLHQQLQQAGVSAENIDDDTADTGTDDNYFSYSEFLKGNKPSNGCHAMVAVMVED